MKKIIGIFLICIISCVALAKADKAGGKLVERSVGPCLKCDESSPIECGYSRPLRIAGMVANPPFGWVEKHDTGELESFGLGRLVLDKLAAKLGFTYESTGFLSYSQAVNAIETGKLDLLISVYTPSKIGKEILPVYPGYFVNDFVAYMKKGKEISINSWNDLKGLKGVVRKEEQIYSPIDEMAKRQGIDLKEVSTEKAFKMLMNGEVDYLFGSPYSENLVLRHYQLENDIVLASSKSLLDMSLFFVFTKKADCYRLTKKFLTALHDLSKDDIEAMLQQSFDVWNKRVKEGAVFIEEDE